MYKLPWDMTTSGHRQWSPFWVAQRTAQVPCPTLLNLQWDFMAPPAGTQQRLVTVLCASCVVWYWDCTGSKLPHNTCAVLHCCGPSVLGLR